MMISRSCANFEEPRWKLPKDSEVMRFAQKLK